VAISLYEATAGLFIQTLGAMEGVLKRGLAHIEDNNIDPKEVLETRLFPDMLPFRYQVQAAVGHSLHAIEGVKSGVYKPPYGDAKADYPALQATVADALAKLQAMSAGDVDALQGRDVVFELGDRKMPFIAEGFLLSFSIPNFHFHATTAYDILRSRGVPLGKRDYLGRLRLKM
jgi:hypothetical protein